MEPQETDQAQDTKAQGTRSDANICQNRADVGCQHIYTITSTPSRLHVAELVFVHAEVVAEFVDDGAADLLANFLLGGTNRLDVFLVEDDGVGARGKIEDAAPGRGNAAIYTEHQLARRQRARTAGAPRFNLLGRQVLDQHRDIVNAAAKPAGQAVEFGLDELEEAIALHKFIVQRRGFYRDKKGFHASYDLRLLA